MAACGTDAFVWASWKLCTWVSLKVENTPGKVTKGQGRSREDK